MVCDAWSWEVFQSPKPITTLKPAAPREHSYKMTEVIIQIKPYLVFIATKSLPSTQQWLMSGAWQLFIHTSAALWALFPLCYTSTTAKLLSLHCTSANYRQNPYICLPLWGESRQQHSHTAVRLLLWGMPLPLTLARLTPVGTLYGTYFL